MLPLLAARRLVIKVGSALVVDSKSNRINKAWLRTLVEDLVRLRQRAQQVLLVSSGAIALGRRRLPSRRIETRRESGGRGGGADSLGSRVRGGVGAAPP